MHIIVWETLMYDVMVRIKTTLSALVQLWKTVHARVSLALAPSPSVLSPFSFIVKERSFNFSFEKMEKSSTLIVSNSKLRFKERENIKYSSSGLTSNILFCIRLCPNRTIMQRPPLNSYSLFFCGLSCLFHLWNDFFLQPFSPIPHLACDPVTAGNSLWSKFQC